MSGFSPVRHFAMSQVGNKTTVHIAEMADGNIWIKLKTERDKVDELATEIMLTPGTFNLLHSAMFRAAHDETVWQSAQKDEDPK